DDATGASGTVGGTAAGSGAAGGADQAQSGAPAGGSQTGGGSGGSTSGRGSGGGGPDVGVTSDTILVGNITSVGGALGPNVFSPSYYGASAFFRELDAKGGVNGHQIKLATCDDKEDPNVNLRCAQSLIEGQK